MNQKPTITLSEQAGALAAKRAAEDGFESVEAYVNALIEEDQRAGTLGWMRARLEEGLASPNAGELTRAKLDRLVDEGVSRVSR